jgi:hypothetical protein
MPNLATFHPQICLKSRTFYEASLWLAEAGGGNTLYPGNVAIYVKNVLNIWDELTLTWNNQPNTQSYYAVGVHNPNNNSTISIDITTLVSGWYSGTSSNYGLLLYNGGSFPVYCVYYSSEGYSSGSARLTVTYTW